MGEEEFRVIKKVALMLSPHPSSSLEAAPKCKLAHQFFAQRCPVFSTPPHPLQVSAALVGGGVISAIQTREKRHFSKATSQPIHLLIHTPLRYPLKVSPCGRDC